jgi:hypothetical protein
MSSKDYLYDLFINDVKGSLELWSGGGSGSGSSGGGSTGGEEWIGDGKTHLWIKIAAEGRMTIPLRFSQTVANGVAIDWGDGSDPQTVNGTGSKSTSHTYASIGEYVITFDVADGCIFSLGYGARNYCVMGNTSNNAYTNMLKKVEIGRDVTSIAPNTFDNCGSLESIMIPDNVTSISEYAFYSCYSLTSIVIPKGVTSIGVNAFGYCYSLTSIVIPKGVTSIGASTFDCCYSLESVTIPESITSIAGNAFSKCHTLESITIPEGVTSIGGNAFRDCRSLVCVTIPKGVMSIESNAFYNCFGMKIYDFTKHTVVPTLSASNALYAPSDCEIRVPAALYDEWIAATNWSTHASKIVAV